MSIYWDILAGVETTLQGLPELAGASVVVRKWPGYQPLQAAVPEVVIAPPKNLAEKIDALQFDNSAWINYKVYLLLVTDARYDRDLLRWRLARREQFRLLFFSPLILSRFVAGEFDVDYDPAPAEVDMRSVPDTLDVTAQAFTYRVSSSRSNP